MARHDQKDTTGRTVAIVGGGALLAWLLLRGRGWGFGTGGSGGARDGDSASATTSPTAPATPAAPPPACRVRLAADGIELDGARADLATTITRCRASGSADVTASGAAIVGTTADVVHALQDAGITVRAEPSLWDVIAGVPRSRP